MEFPADARRELVDEFDAIVSADAASADLATAVQVVTGCRRLRGLLAARDAEFTPVLEELRRQAALESLREHDDTDTGMDTADPDASDTDESDADTAPDDPAVPTDTADDTATGDGNGNGEPSGGSPGAAPGGGGAGDRGGQTGPRESVRERRQRELRSRWLAVFERFAEALATGQISPEHADRLATICQRLPPTLIPALRNNQTRLVRLAVGYPADAFAINVNDWVRDLHTDNGTSEFDQQLADSRASMWHDRVTGLYHLTAIFDPRRGPVVQHALDQATLRLLNDDHHQTRRQHAAQALYDLITRSPTTGTGGAATNTAWHRTSTGNGTKGNGVDSSHDADGGSSAGNDPVDLRGANAGALVVVDYQTAITGLTHAHTVCENVDGTPLPTDIALRACAYANIQAAILDRAGKPADLTTHQRLATAAQRGDLRAMGNHCVHPDCTQPWTRCHIHHVQFHHDHHGPTAVSNLVPVCNQHHHDIHDRGWTLTIDAQRTLRWYRPDGTLYAEIPHTRLDKRPFHHAESDPPSAAADTTDPPPSPPLPADSSTAPADHQHRTPSAPPSGSDRRAGRPEHAAARGPAPGARRPAHSEARPTPEHRHAPHPPDGTEPTRREPADTAVPTVHAGRRNGASMARLDGAATTNGGPRGGRDTAPAASPTLFDSDAA